MDSIQVEVAASGQMVEAANLVAALDQRVAAVDRIVAMGYWGPRVAPGSVDSQVSPP